MNIEIIGGGTFYHVRNHLSLAAPAFGTTAKVLGGFCRLVDPVSYNINVHLTKMAGGREGLETNEDVEKLVDRLIADKQTKIIFFNVALVDFKGSVLKEDLYEDNNPSLGSYLSETISGKYEDRLKTSEGDKQLLLTPSPKLIAKIRKERKDIFLVGFKTTCGASEDEQFLTGLHLLKSTSCNLVLANDTKTRTNMVITPEQARYHVTTDRDQALLGLTKMALQRARGTFTRSTVIEGKAIDWDVDNIPLSLKKVVDHCVAQGAYKPFNGSTVGHFAFKKNNTDFITSKRKTNFNNLDKVGMVLCRAEGGNKVTAYGHKPSVGGQSQRIIFNEHPGMDCIVHFHCPPKPNAKVNVRSQMNFECGSHECGKNTSDGLTDVGDGIKCVYLDNHGPNIVFNRSADWRKVVEFIDANFDLSKSTDGVDRNKLSVG